MNPDHFFAKSTWSKLVSLSLLVGMASAALAQTSADTLSVLARGPAGTVIRVNDVISELQQAPEANRQAFMSNPDAVEQLVSNLLIRRVLAAEAERDGLGKDPVVAAALAIGRDRALSNARLEKLDAQNTPSEAALDAQAQKIYNANPAKFEKPAQTRASHILLANSGSDSLQKAKEILAQLRAGASFEALAKAHSTDPGSAARGGDLGFFGAGKMVRPFEDAVSALKKPGDLSEPVESQFGYHLIRLEERREKGPQPYAEVRQQLTEEARTTLLNESRVTKVQTINKDMIFDRSAIEAFAKPGTR